MNKKEKNVKNFPRRKNKEDLFAAIAFAIVIWFPLFSVSYSSTYSEDKKKKTQEEFAVVGKFA